MRITTVASKLLNNRFLAKQPIRPFTGKIVKSSNQGITSQNIKEITQKNKAKVSPNLLSGIEKSNCGIFGNFGKATPDELHSRLMDSQKRGSQSPNGSDGWAINIQNNLTIIKQLFSKEFHQQIDNRDFYIISFSKNPHPDFSDKKLIEMIKNFGLTIQDTMTEPTNTDILPVSTTPPPPIERWLITIPTTLNSVSPSLNKLFTDIDINPNEPISKRTFGKIMTLFEILSTTSPGLKPLNISQSYSFGSLIKEQYWRYFSNLETLPFDSYIGHTRAATRMGNLGDIPHAAIDGAHTKDRKENGEDTNVGSKLTELQRFFNRYDLTLCTERLSDTMINELYFKLLLLHDHDIETAFAFTWGANDDIGKELPQSKFAKFTQGNQHGGPFSAFQDIPYWANPNEKITISHTDRYTRRPIQSTQGDQNVAIGSNLQPNDMQNIRQQIIPGALHQIAPDGITIFKSQTKIREEYEQLINHMEYLPEIKLQQDKSYEPRFIDWLERSHRIQKDQDLYGEFISQTTKGHPESVAMGDPQPDGGTLSRADRGTFGFIPCNRGTSPALPPGTTAMETFTIVGGNYPDNAFIKPTQKSGNGLKIPGILSSTQGDKLYEKLGDSVKKIDITIPRFSTPDAYKNTILKIVAEVNEARHLPETRVIAFDSSNCKSVGFLPIDLSYVLGHFVFEPSPNGYKTSYILDSSTHLFPAESCLSQYLLGLSSIIVRSANYLPINKQKMLINAQQKILTRYCGSMGVLSLEQLVGNIDRLSPTRKYKESFLNDIGIGNVFPKKNRSKANYDWNEAWEDTIRKNSPPSDTSRFLKQPVVTNKTVTNIHHFINEVIKDGITAENRTKSIENQTEWNNRLHDEGTLPAISKLNLSSSVSIPPRRHDIYILGLGPAGMTLLNGIIQKLKDNPNIPCHITILCDVVGGAGRTAIYPEKSHYDRMLGISKETIESLEYAERRGLITFRGGIKLTNDHVNEIIDNVKENGGKIFSGLGAAPPRRPTFPGSKFSISPNIIYEASSGGKLTAESYKEYLRLFKGENPYTIVIEGAGDAAIDQAMHFSDRGIGGLAEDNSRMPTVIEKNRLRPDITLLIYRKELQKSPFKLKDILEFEENGGKVLTLLNIDLAKENLKNLVDQNDSSNDEEIEKLNFLIDRHSGNSLHELDSTKVIPQRTIVLLENTSTTKISEHDDHYAITIKSQSEDITISAGAHVFCAGYDPETDTRITDKSVTYIGQQSGKYGTIGSTLKDVEPIIIEACNELDKSPPAGNNKAFDWITQTFNGSSNIQNGTQAARMLSNIGAKFNEKSDIMAALYTDNQPKKTKFDAADYCNKNAITGTKGKITLHSLDVNQTVVCSAINEASVYKVAAKIFTEKNWPFPLDASCGEDKSCGTCGAFEVDKDRRKTDSKVVNDGDTMTCDIESTDAAEKGKVYLIGKPPKQEEN